MPELQLQLFAHINLFCTTMFEHTMLNGAHLPQAPSLAAFAVLIMNLLRSKVLLPSSKCVLTQTEQVQTNLSHDGQAWPSA